MKLIKNNRKFIIISLSVCLVLGISISLGFDKFAWALSPNYSKTLPGATLSVTEWNNLALDFVAKSGDSMTGILNMNGSRITGLADPAATSDAANKAYVDAQFAAMAGISAAAIYTNWGRSDCPSGSELLYSGIAFSAHYGSVGGSSNIVCLDDSGVAGSIFSEPNSDKLYPLVTGNSASLPAPISSGKAVRCAVCRHVGTCYETFGNTACNTSLGFTVAYSGYLMGAHSNSSTYLNSTERACVNGIFDSTITPSSSEGAIWIGTRIDNNLGLSYTTNSFIRCSICCN